MVQKRKARVNVEAIINDLDRIRRRWRQFKKVAPGNSFWFIAHIVRTGRIPPVPDGKKAA